MLTNLNNFFLKKYPLATNIHYCISFVTVKIVFIIENGREYEVLQI